MRVITGFGLIAFLDYIEDWQLRLGWHIVVTVVAVLFIMYQLSKD